MQTNGTKMSELRRNKFLQTEAVRKAQLNACGQKLALSIADVEHFLTLPKPSPFKAVVKPVEGAGSDGVSICYSEQEVRDCFNALQGTQNVLGLTNTEVLLQEYLSGDEVRRRAARPPTPPPPPSRRLRPRRLRRRPERRAPTRARLASTRSTWSTRSREMACISASRSGSTTSDYSTARPSFITACASSPSRPSRSCRSFPLTARHLVVTWPPHGRYIPIEAEP